MKIMVTGGAGFIGSNFIRYLLEKYDDVEIINYDKLTYAGNLNNLRDVEDNRRYNFVRGDICDNELVEKIIKKNEVEQLINFAAESHVDRSITGPEHFVKTDIFGTFTLLDACRKYNVKKYIQISTDEVYGSIEKGSFEETDPLNPSSPYSASKASADMIVNSYYITYGLPVKITRSTNNFGPYQYPEKLIPSFIINALMDKPLPLYGDGLNVRDWLYVEDNCEAIDVVMQKGKNGEVYNIGSGNEKTNIDITKLILKALSKKESLIHYVKDRPGHDRRYSLDVTKIKNLGWKPRHRFEDAMRKTIKWYANNRWWWESIEGK
ncbi:MAG: dTDP-glucose 4,6-dehydratase [Nanoarchaeota archaeon]|nr:dTDP-glucose 4,6-dehydratase [Nanoarchaeota archaeon]